MAMLPILPSAAAPLLPAIWRRIRHTPAARLAIGFSLVGRHCWISGPTSEPPCGCRTAAAQARALQLARMMHPARRTVPAQQQAQWLAAAGVVGSRLDVLSREWDFACDERRPVGLLVNVLA